MLKVAKMCLCPQRHSSESWNLSGFLIYTFLLKQNDNHPLATGR